MRLNHEKVWIVDPLDGFRCGPDQSPANWSPPTGCWDPGSPVSGPPAHSLLPETSESHGQMTGAPRSHHEFHHSGSRASSGSTGWLVPQFCESLWHCLPPTWRKPQSAGGPLSWAPGSVPSWCRRPPLPGCRSSGKVCPAGRCEWCAEAPHRPRPWVYRRSSSDCRS